MNRVELLNEISSSMDNLINFVVEDDFISKDFEDYLQVNKIEIEGESAFNTVIMSYILEGRTQDMRSVLDCYKEKHQDSKIVESLKNSFCGIFEIKKISSFSYEVYSLTSECEMSLTSLIKTTNLRSIGRYDFIYGRVVKIEDEFFLLEIFDCYGSNYKRQALRKGIEIILSKPSSLFYNNFKKYDKVQKQIETEYGLFIKCFGKNKIITTNKKADELIDKFNKYCFGENVNFEGLIEEYTSERYFDFNESGEDTFMQNASLGFSQHQETYDVGILYDKQFGFFAIPFLNTFEKILNGEKIENSSLCVLNFLFDEKIPPSVFYDFEDKMDVFNKILDEVKISSFKDMDEMMKYFKPQYFNSQNCSTITALYNSEAFSEYFEFEKDMV